jgi:hypothetical protein
VQQFLMSFESFKADPVWQRIQKINGKDWAELYTEFHQTLREAEDVSPEDLEAASEYYDRVFVTPIDDVDVIINLQAQYAPFLRA